MDFENDRCSYSLYCFPDTVPGVFWRTRPKGWMDSSVILEWFEEIIAIKTYPDGKRRVLLRTMNRATR